MFEKAVAIVAKHNVGNEVTLSQQCGGIVEKRPHSQEINVLTNEEPEIQISATLNISEEAYNAINQELGEAGIQFSFEKKLGVGSKFGDYPEIEKLDSDTKYVLKHQGDEVLLVDVWATWCGPCQRPMQHNQEMIVKHADKWAKKVRIACVSVDDDKDTVKQRINSKGWTALEHYCLKGWDNEYPLIKNFSISGIPFVCLVNKRGEIVYTGHPAQINLEERIDALLAEAAPNAPGGQAEGDFIDAVTADQLKKVLSKESFEKNFSKVDLLSVKWTISKESTNGHTKHKGTIQVSTFEGQKQLFTVFKGLFTSLKNVKLTENQVKFAKVPQKANSHCSLCNKQGNLPYWLKWEQAPAFACKECVEAKQDNHFKYNKNSVYLPNKWEKIAQKSLGKNIQPEHVKDVQRPHAFGCNSCGQPSKKIGEARYICLACRADPNYFGDYVDACQSCFHKYLAGQNEAKTGFNVSGHNESHPWLRILYNVKGYYEF